MRCEELRELADVFALGALDEADRGEVEQHLATCSECQTIVDQAQALASQLAFAAPLRRAPAALHNRIMASIDVERRLSKDSGEPVPAQPLPIMIPAAAAVASVGAARRPRVWWPALAAGVAVFFLIGASSWIAALQMQVSHLQQQSQVFQKGMSDVQGQRAALFLLMSTGSTTVAMNPVNPSLNVQGTVIWNMAREQCSILADQLPAAPAGESYHVWFMLDSSPGWDSGSMVTGQNGSAEKTVDLHNRPTQQGYRVVIMLQPDQNNAADRHPVLTATVD